MSSCLKDPGATKTQGFKKKKAGWGGYFKVIQVWKSLGDWVTVKDCLSLT